MSRQHPCASFQRSLNTLAQSETVPKPTGEYQKLLLVHGNGTDLSNSKALQRRAKCKLITQKTILGLIDVAKERQAKDRLKAYWNTYHCQNRIYTSQSKLYTKYCKNRFCTVCCGIRRAELIGKYLPEIKTWESPYFVTLTVKAVPANRLRVIIKGIIRAFRKIKAKYRKRNQRGTTIKLVGLKTLECNFNPKHRTYNPHLHLIVPNQQTAEILIKEWLTIWTRKYTHRDAQHYREVDETEEDLLEIIKYGSKIFTEPGAEKPTGKRSSHKIYAVALDNIYTAMKGSRIFERFGFNLPRDTKKKKVPGKLIYDFQEWEYHSKCMDWLHKEHESTLAAYFPSPQLMDLMEYNIDTELG